MQNWYLDYLIDLGFQEEIDSLFYHMKIMIHGRNFLNQPVKNDQITYVNIEKTLAGQGDDYTTGFLLNQKTFIRW